FPTLGGTAVWFDIFAGAQRLQVRETGNPAPAVLFTEARLPELHLGSIRIDIEPGTVWVRGDLLPAGLPANAYVGFKVTSGSLKLDTPATINGDLVEVAPHLAGVLLLELAKDEVVPAAGACTSAAATVTLPE